MSTVRGVMSTSGVASAGGPRTMSKQPPQRPEKKGVGLLCQAEPRAFDAQRITFAGRLRTSIMVTGGHQGVLHVMREAYTV